MINFTQAIILGVLQGVTELFPISSLGHSVILPQLLGWSINQRDPAWLTFLVATHLATALVLLLFFARDWLAIISEMYQSIISRQIGHNHYGKLGWLIVVGTIPAGLLGLMFQEPLQNLFASPKLVAIFLIGNGILLGIGELLRRRARDGHENSAERISNINFKQSIFVGGMQSLALLPGFSRTGSTLVAGLVSGLSHFDAARFSFLLATPIITAAAVLKLPELATTPEGQDAGPVLVGAIGAALAAWFSVRFLTKYFQTNKLWPFAAYCFIGGIAYLLILNLK